MRINWPMKENASISDENKFKFKHYLLSAEFTLTDGPKTS